MRILLTGSTGFVGSAVARALRTDPSIELRLLTRPATPSSTPHAPDTKDEIAIGDLGNPASLSEAVRGVDAVVHAASSVHGDADEAEAVNTTGTANLVEAAAAHGVGRLIYISTTSVYGAGPHRGDAGLALSAKPESAVSRSRARAEETVLAAGGKVVRAGLSYGAGDRWLIPTVVAAVRGLGAIPSVEARASLINVGRLGDAVAALASAYDETPEQVFHAAHPKSISFVELVDSLNAVFRLDLPRTEAQPGMVAAFAQRAGLSEHQLALLTVDHWYEADLLWSRTGAAAGESPEFSAADIEWYRNVFLRATDRDRTD